MSEINILLYPDTDTIPHGDGECPACAKSYLRVWHSKVLNGECYVHEGGLEHVIIHGPPQVPDDLDMSKPFIISGR